MKCRSPRRGDWYVTNISPYKTARILHALRQTQCDQRETHSAYKTA
ncbi:unnamed protein product [Bemisia tabaci]|uniref:Uncharacterized protein n=1 Tax=Bemisia tabaci TaxID=7038 RepID=A0A9P0A758_BEMTA|nr:unnamed protein product [Bemisia tabaci]